MPLQAGGASAVRISGVLFDGALAGAPEPESAIRLTNTDARRSHSLSGYSLDDGLARDTAVSSGPAGEAASGSGAGRAPALGRARRVRRAMLPEGAAIAPGGELWLAHQGRAFEQVFGFQPDYEAVDTLPQVPELVAEQGWLVMPAEHGAVTLRDAHGEPVDFVAYERGKKAHFAAGDLPEEQWRGPAVRLLGSSAYGWTNQMLARDRDEAGRLLVDTDSAADWDSGNSEKALGQEPTHRVEMPGQTHFRTRRLRKVRARVTATSAPDNNFRALQEALMSARREIRISVYQLTQGAIADILLRKLGEGVRVKLWLEGAPVGGIPDQERYLVDQLRRAGAEVHFLVSDASHRIRARYRFDHSKYTLIDDRRVIIGTENYGRTGVPVHPSHGNRGWMVHIEEPGFFAQMDALWRADYQPGRFRDVVSIDASPDDPYGLPYRDPAFRPDDTLQRGLYPKPVAPMVVDDLMDLELVLSPDTSLNENTAIIGMIQRARRELYIQQNSVRRRWGRKRDTVDKTPDLPLEAVIAAARRGVRVRVLLDGTWYNIQGDDDRDNDDTARALNELARREGLDLSAKVINLETTHLEKIHAKGVIADRQEVFVGSINWSENSFKGNREVGVIVGHPKVAGYYAALFERDWAESRMYQITAKGKAPLLRAPGGAEVGRVLPGERQWVVGEHGGAGDDGLPAWLEVRTSFGHTAFLSADAVGDVQASAREALHLVGRHALVEGRVAQTRVSGKVIQLRFEDETRPPFVAVIFRSAEDRFRAQGLVPSQAFQGRVVRVRGRIQQYKSPEVVLARPDQIELVP